MLGLWASGACERSQRTQEPQETAAPPGASDAATAPPLDGALPGLDVIRDATGDARAVPVQDMAWRKALDEVVQRLDRGDPPARVAELFGSVVPTGSGGVRIKSALSWTPAVELRLHDKDLQFLITLDPWLPLRELEAAMGSCSTLPFGDFGDGVLIVCPPFATRRGAMRVSATTAPRGGDGYDSVLDLLIFDWTPTPAHPR